MDSIRRPIKFTSMDGSIAYTFPRERLDYDATQPLDLSSVQLTGASYDYDLMGDQPALRRNGAHTLRFILLGTPEAVETAVDTMRVALYNGARGWFYVEDSQGFQRRAVARITEMPQVHLGTRDRASAPVVVTFAQYSDFYDTSNIDEHDGAIQLLASDPDTIFVNNPGNALVYNAKFTIKGAYDGVTIENVSLPVPGTTAQHYIVEVDVTGVDSTDWLEIDCGARTIRVSTDSGATWTNVDVADIITQEGQVSMMVMKAGVNELLIGGCNACQFETEFAGAYV